MDPVRHQSTFITSPSKLHTPGQADPPSQAPDHGVNRKTLGTRAGLYGRAAIPRRQHYICVCWTTCKDIRGSCPPPHDHTPQHAAAAASPAPGASRRALRWRALLNHHRPRPRAEHVPWAKAGAVTDAAPADRPPPLAALGPLAVPCAPRLAARPRDVASAGAAPRQTRARVAPVAQVHPLCRSCVVGPRKEGGRVRGHGDTEQRSVAACGGVTEGMRVGGFGIARVSRGGDGHGAVEDPLRRAGGMCAHACACGDGDEREERKRAAAGGNEHACGGWW